MISTAKKFIRKFITNDALYKPFDLNIARIFFFGALLFNTWSKADLLIYTISSYQNLREVMWLPVGIFQFYPQNLLIPIETLRIMHFIYSLSLLFCMAGLYTRISNIMAFILSLFFIGYANNFGAVFNSTTFVPVVLLILCFSNIGSSFSLDSFFRTKKGDNVNDNTLSFNSFTLRFISSLFFLFYFLAALQKLRLTGVDWFLSEKIGLDLIESYSSLGKILSQFPFIYKSLGFLVVLFQLSCILPVFFRKLVPYYLILTGLFHIGLDITLGSHFSIHTYTFFFMVPWISLLSYFLKRPLFNRAPKINLKSLFKIPNFFAAISIYLIIFLFFIYSAYDLNRSFYPFSDKTMYAYEAVPIKREQIYIETNHQETHLSSKEITPIDHYRMRHFLKHLELKNDKEQAKKFLKRIVSTTIFKNGTMKGPIKIILNHCYWNSYHSYIHHYRSMMRCKEYLKTEIK